MRNKIYFVLIIVLVSFLTFSRPAVALSEPTCFGKTVSEWSAFGYTVKVGTEANNRLDGTNGQKDVLMGLGGDDTLNGNDGDDIICGGDGIDKINGGDGNDYIDGESGNDIIDGYTGDDVVFGKEGDDQLIGNRGDDVISAGAGNDKIYGNDGDDTVNGDEGQDRIEGGAGNNILSGGSDNDNVIGYVQDDILFGNDGDDVITAKGGVDIVDGGRGSDSLYGEDKNDLLIGNEGPDTLYGGNGADSLIGDCFPLSSVLTSEQQARIAEAEVLIGQLYDSSCENSFNDTINGDGSVDIILGDSGRLAPNGEVVIYPTHEPGYICGTCVDYPNDKTVLILGKTYEMYGEGDDQINGGNGGAGEVLNTPERLYGNGGNDTIVDPDGDEYFYGGPGNDTLIAYWGTDYLYGGDGIDYCDAGGNNQGVLVDAGWGCETSIGIEAGEGQVTPTPTPTSTVMPTITPTPSTVDTPTDFAVSILEPADNYQLPTYTSTKITVESTAISSTIEVFFDSMLIYTCNTTSRCTIWYGFNSSDGAHTLSTEATSTYGAKATDSIKLLR